MTNRYGIPIRPPTPAETSPPPGGDPQTRDDTYIPPTGGPVSWPHTELGPDTDLPHQREPARPALTLVRTTPPDPDAEQDPVEDLYDDLVHDSYRPRRH